MLETQPVSPTVAVLGPFGTYSHQAAFDKFGDSVRYREEKTITDVFNALSDGIQLAVVPQENSIFGTVVETYDLLRCLDMGHGKVVKGVVTLSIQHCLLVRKGVKFEEIGRILSHEQALGQCSQFIKNHFPHASLEKTPSTAAAAKFVLLDNGHVKCAAICSKICATVFDDLEVLCEGIQNENVNTTRFYIIGMAGCLVPPVAGRPRCALVRTAWKPTNTTENGTGDVTTLLATLGLHATRVDRRPSLDRTPFHDVYFVEVEQSEMKTEPGQPAWQNWEAEVQQALRRVHDICGDACLLGIW